MRAFVSSVSSVGVIAMLGAMFVIVFVCVRRAVKEMSFFGDAAGSAVTFCVALLSILGLVRFFGPSETAATPTEAPGESGGLLDFVVLPYVALALTILLMLLLLPLGKRLHGRELGHLLGGWALKGTAGKSKMQESDYHQRETKPFASPVKRQITGRENGQTMKQSESGR